MWSRYRTEFRYNWNLAAPVIIGMLGHTLVGLVDNIMVGQLGTAELAAVSLGNSFFFVAMGLGIGFSTAITPLVAQSKSEKNYKKVKSVFNHGFVLCTIVAFILFLLVIFSKPIMYKMNQPQEVVLLAQPYLDIIAISLIPLIVFQAFKQFSDGLSMTKYPMYVTIFANLVNVVINYLLIFGKFGFPRLGLIGAGIGTLISRFLMVVLIWLLLSNLRSTRTYLNKLKFFVFDNLMIKKIFALGFPSALQMFFEIGIFTAAIWLSGTLGKNHQAANQIALNLSSMTYMIAVGLGVAATIRVGNQKGLKKPIELRRIAKSVFAMGISLALFFAVFFLLFNTKLPSIYLDMDDSIKNIDNREVIGIASNLLIIAALYQISDSTQVIFLGALRALQDVKIPTIIIFVSYWIIGFPLCYFLGKESIYSSVGIWVGLLVGLTLSSIFLFIRFDYLSKKMISKK